MSPKRLIIGVSGASGAPIALELLRALQSTEIESHLIITEGGEQTILHETGLTVQDFAGLADQVYDNKNIGAAPASGSYRTIGMAVVPCSMKTLAGISSVTLKERRKLVLAARECPLSAVHLRNMYELTKIGAVILPPVLSFYNRPETLQDATCHIVGKILDQFDIPYAPFKRWEG